MASLVNPSGDKDPPTASVPTDKKKNPYFIRKSNEALRDRITKPGKLVTLMCDYMTIIESQSRGTNKQWDLWRNSGLNDPKMTVHLLAKIVSYPDVKDKTLLNVGLYMLEKTPELARFMKLSTASRHHEPILHHTKPVISEWWNQYYQKK